MVTSSRGARPGDTLMLAEAIRSLEATEATAVADRPEAHTAGEALIAVIQVVVAACRLRRLIAVDMEATNPTPVPVLGTVLGVQVVLVAPDALQVEVTKLGRITMVILAAMAEVAAAIVVRLTQRMVGAQRHTMFLLLVTEVALMTGTLVDLMSQFTDLK